MFGDCEGEFGAKAAGRYARDEDGFVFDGGGEIGGDFVAVCEGGVEWHFCWFF